MREIGKLTRAEWDALTPDEQWVFADVMQLSIQGYIQDTGASTFEIDGSFRVGGEIFIMDDGLSSQ